MCVMLGDNVLERGIRREVSQFRKQKKGARVLLKEVPNARDYGVAEFDGVNIKRIVEKPKNPRSAYAVIGVYFYDAAVFKALKGLKLSKRGEYEITDVNNAYVKRHQMTYNIIDGFWADCGASIDAYLAANNLMARAHELEKVKRRMR
jgi:glucose-1-phosphate thymidylyltransferase